MRRRAVAPLGNFSALGRHFLDAGTFLFRANYYYSPSEQQRKGPAHGAAGWRAPQLSSRQRRRARARAQAAVPLQPADDSEREMMM